MRSTTPITRVAWLLATVLTIMLSGCSSPPPSEPNTESSEPDTESPVATYVRSSNWGEGDSALLEGRLVLENDCLTVVGDTNQIIVPIFPTDFTWDDKSNSLSGFGHTFTVGDSISLGGGETTATIAEYLPHGCEGGQYFIVHSA